MTSKREAGTYIASCKVNCNVSDKSIPHTSGSNNSISREDKHIKNFGNLSCSNWKRIFHHQLRLQHKLSSEQEDRELAKWSPSNIFRGARNNEKWNDHFLPIFYIGAEMVQKIVRESHLESLATAPVKTRNVLEMEDKKSSKSMKQTINHSFFNAQNNYNGS